MPKKNASYQEMNAALAAILERLQQADIQVDEAIKLYEEGLTLAAALETYVQRAENSIQKVKLQGNATE